MTGITPKAFEFMRENDRSPVVSGGAHGPGQRGTYTLKNGQHFSLSERDCRSLPEGYPKWIEPLAIAPKGASKVAGPGITEVIERLLVVEEKSVTRGQLEAFEFMAKQFRVYADDNDEIHRRYGTTGKSALAVSAKRSQTFRDAAEECEAYADKCRKELGQ